MTRPPRSGSGTSRALAPGTSIQAAASASACARGAQTPASAPAASATASLSRRHPLAGTLLPGVTGCKTAYISRLPGAPPTGRAIIISSMKMLMGAGLALMNMLTTPQKMAASAVAFTLPLGIVVCALILSGMAWSEPVLLLIAGSYALALYSTLGHHYQVLTTFGGLREAIQRFSRGNFEFRGEGAWGGTETGVLLDQIKDMSARLAAIFEKVRASSDVINQAAREIISGHVNLSQRTEEQATTLEETASGMEELSGTVQKNAKNCQLADGLSRGASEVAEKGAQTVHRAVERMAMIDQSSKKIVDIIGVIEGIAFQTNILALNAAVEAARAGGQGRGFAGGGGGVRKLARRSAQAAKEIKALIEDSVGNVSEGGKLVGEAGGIIKEIVTSVRQASERIGEISQASQEQSSGVGEINKALAQMEAVTQQNAALVEQATAAILSFEEEADRLGEAVSTFKLAAPANVLGAKPAAAAKPAARVNRPAAPAIPAPP